ncbi:hypothetical protein LWC05_16930 [Acetobacter sicerae]|uniref:Uncharacterized protein n=1 Tax=Acetobacter sicerae TaxID=85325 RepID=A0ABS8VZD0_9PROT|nr:hypothetical protein [Acetobacter sicerae]MCE0745556.1 hypothetical protein [Acetobacter sicerae]
MSGAVRSDLLHQTAGLCVTIALRSRQMSRRTPKEQSARERKAWVRLSAAMNDAENQCRILQGILRGDEENG